MTDEQIDGLLDSVVHRYASKVSAAREEVAARMLAHGLYGRDGWSLGESSSIAAHGTESRIWPVKNAIPGFRPTEERPDLGVCITLRSKVD